MAGDQPLPPVAHTLLSAIVDYAGLFPPAALSMADAVAHYATERNGADAWMLGRFVVPAARLGEFAQALAAQPPQGTAWPLSATVAGNLEANLMAVEGFRAPGATIVSLEVKVDTPEQVDALAARVPPGLETFVELPLDGPLPALVARVAAHGLKAKIRTGGITPDSIPVPGDVMAFLQTVVQARVPFKATAGLHHPLRGEFPLTYDANAPRATMYGHLNVLLATAALRAGWGAESVEALLGEHDPAAFRLEDQGIRWRDSHLDAALLDETRRRHFLSFGSCSFREPVDEGRALTTATS